MAVRWNGEYEYEDRNVTATAVRECDPFCYAYVSVTSPGFVAYRRPRCVTPFSAVEVPYLTSPPPSRCSIVKYGHHISQHDPEAPTHQLKLSICCTTCFAILMLEP